MESGMASKHKKPGAKNPNIFDKPMDNPFNEYVQSPAPKEKGQEKPPLDKPMENPFRGIERSEKKSPSSAVVPKRKMELAHAKMPPRREVPPKSPEEVEKSLGPGNTTIYKEKPAPKKEA